MVTVAGAAGDARAQASEEGIERSYFTTSDGWRLHYARLGSTGTPVILIHGSGGAAQVWLDNRIAPELAKSQVVIAADMRGHGRSEGPRNGRHAPGRHRAHEPPRDSEGPRPRLFDGG